ncbi:thiamine-phosphate pyrophosphorylase [Pedobacter antarcticus 4BY]|uniref:Thiamine-phosphate pyrophosphorylase n=1 Tax=Pedobacter antarcticus 4BY TaxID=1358423 RepID=A0A081PL88_9SPHI|nr:thiamine phosphate synthase [Pedobacter antarcticus]KEQ31461.1 thiamine-phosphate pyrophosphorylase [Pedobacter antarcticus 4BY]
MKKYIEKLQFITHDIPGLSHIDQARIACEAGAKWIQYRCLTKNDQELLADIIPIAEICDDWGATLIVTEHIHLSKLADIQGFHLEDTHAPIDAIKEQLGEEFTVGGTAHTAADAVRLALAGADYIGYGPFKTSTTKLTDLAPLGTAGFNILMEEANTHLPDVPIIAVGGITAADIAALMDTGIFGIAASSAINQAEDMGEAYREFYALLR